MNMRNYYQKFLKKSERGQAIVLIIFAFVGLVAMVGLVTDTGLVLIEYGKLKRSVDAAAIAAAQEYRPDPDTGDLNVTLMENAAANMLRLNQTNNVSNIVVTTCEDPADIRPVLCNPDPIGTPVDNRKLVEVAANADVSLAFLRVLGIRSVTLSANAVGEAATIDLVLIIDTSGGMAYGTSGDPTKPDSGDDPIACNAADNCEPMRRVKDTALEFVNSLIYFGYDRVSVIAMTGQMPNANAEGRYPVEILPLTFDKNMIGYSIDNLKVFQPRICKLELEDGEEPEAGECLKFNSGTGVFEGPFCHIYEHYSNSWWADPSSCPSSNIGGTLRLAQQAFSGSGDPSKQRPEALWVVVVLASGPANATDAFPERGFPTGYCPQNTWVYPIYIDPSAPLYPNADPGKVYFPGPRCRDKYPSTRHSQDDTAMYINPRPDYPGDAVEISIYDAEDYARDMADNLAAMKTGGGVTIYTIGLGEQIRDIQLDYDKKTQIEPEHPPAEFLLEYIAEQAGNTLNPDINHGSYFYAPNSLTLRNIFDVIARNISTKISQ